MEKVLKEKMIGKHGSAEEIKVNEMKALFFMDKSKTSVAEKILLKNLRQKTSSILTYDLLIRIYDKNQNYHLMIDILNHGIKNTEKKIFYKKLKKQVIMACILEEMKSV